MVTKMFQPTCINTGCDNPVTYSATYKNGSKRWRPVCNSCHRASYGAQQLAEGVKPIKKTYCENIDSRLGFKCTTTIPYPGALEIDHIDGDREHNTTVNVQTLCKVCHSYKGHINNDFKKDRQKQKEMLV